MTSLRLLAGAAVVALMTASGAVAAEVTDPPGATVDEVVVTAQKREQNLQDVAGSVSAMGSERLQAEGIDSIGEISSRVPGLDFGQHNGAAFVTLRGIGLAVDTGVAEPNVAVHVDGVFLPRTTMETLDGLDLERVEVLRGPQGTLYGRNATGGAVNFVSQAPGAEFKSEGQLLVGNYETVEVKGMVTGPFTDTLSGRLSVGYARRGEGYTDNTFTNNDLDRSERFKVRGALRADLTDTLTVDLSLAYQRETFQTYQQLVQAPGPLAAVLFPPLATAESPSSPWEIGNDYEPNSKRSTFLARLGVQWDITPDIELKSITGYINHKFRNAIDGDGTSADYIVIRDRTQPSEAISQEFDLGGALPNKGSWLVGAYFFREEFTSSIPVVLPLGQPLLGLPPETTLLSELHEKTTSMAVFADVTVGLTDRLRIYGGVRASQDKKDFNQSAGAIFVGVPPSLTLTCDQARSSETFDAVTPRAGLQFDLGDNAMVYAQYSKGFKSGGLNSSACGDTYDPEELAASEVGLKSEFLDGRLVFNVSAFHYDYSALQVFKIVGLNAVIENADARVYGADFEGRFRLNDYFRVDGSATVLDAEFTKFLSADPANPGAGTQDLKGQSIPRAPKYLANLGLEGQFPVAVGPFTELTVRADVRWSGKMYFQSFNTEGYSQDAYSTVNLNASLLTDDRGLTLRAFVRNATDEPVLGHVFYNSIQDSYLGNYLPPRTFGVEVTRVF